MINIAICDDEISVVKQTKELIENYNKYEIKIYTFTNGEELINSKKTLILYS